MKSIAQPSVAVFVMLTLAVVYAAAQQPTVTARANRNWLYPRAG
jgi:hypothetical protein